ncbi:MAG: hypothetical protein ACI8R9_000304 [Paraglaciecola sp.]|jgi:hypothetical protein
MDEMAIRFGKSAYSTLMLPAVIELGAHMARVT